MKSNIYLLLIVIILGAGLLLVASDCNDSCVFILKGIAGLILGGISIVVYNALNRRGALGDEPEEQEF